MDLLPNLFFLIDLFFTKDLTRFIGIVLIFLLRNKQGWRFLRFQFNSLILVCQLAALRFELKAALIRPFF